MLSRRYSRHCRHLEVASTPGYILALHYFSFFNGSLNPRVERAFKRIWPYI